MKILGIIPARKGSKGIPNKCLRPLCGKPLLQWTLDAASACTSITDCVLTTDYTANELRQAKAYGEVNGIRVLSNWDLCRRQRPASLCTDDARGVDVALDALWSHGGDFDAVAYLQPTCPLRTAEQIDRYAAMAINAQFTCLHTNVDVGGWRPERMTFLDNFTFTTSPVCNEPEFGANRQKLSDCVIRSGSFYFATVEHLVRERSFGSCGVRELDPLNWVNIDDERDWILAEALMQRRLAGDYKARPGNDQTARVNDSGHLENADGRLLPLEGVDAG